MTRGDRHNIGSGTVWEDRVGYSRAVRIGSVVEVAGTTAVDDQGRTVRRGDPGAQARFIIAKIERALQQAGASLSDVVRTRMFVVDITRWEAIGEAHGQAFGAIRPVTTMVEVKSLISPDLLVEIEATAIIQKGS
jgi:enamine deaminase RidA (YjgF/YER057c/UK114 family)